MSEHAADDTVPEVDESRRKFLIAATAGTGAVGAVLTAVPFLASWQPSESARAAGLPTEVDLSRLEPGQMTTVFWRKKQIYVVRRTPEMLATLGNHDGELKDAKSDSSEQPEYAKNPARALRPDVFVTIGTCTHLGCLPKTRFTPGDATLSADWPGGFFCPCHGSKFDLAGRVFAGSPASVNLTIPPYSFEGENKLIVGVDAAEKGAA
jgi:ubiquinol-cytochrome c reductase iron-sulfur subunit